MRVSGRDVLGGMEDAGGFKWNEEFKRNHDFIDFGAI
jgi:hypothetical protein